MTRYDAYIHELPKLQTPFFMYLLFVFIIHVMTNKLHAAYRERKCDQVQGNATDYLILFAPK